MLAAAWVAVLAVAAAAILWALPSRQHQSGWGGSVAPPPAAPAPGGGVEAADVGPARHGTARDGATCCQPVHASLRLRVSAGTNDVRPSPLQLPPATDPGAQQAAWPGRLAAVLQRHGLVQGVVEDEEEDDTRARTERAAPCGTAAAGPKAVQPLAAAKTPFDLACQLVRGPVPAYYEAVCVLERVAIKVPDRHISDLPADGSWVEPIANALNAHDMALTGVYVREGCIQLVLEVVHACGPPAAAPGNDTTLRASQHRSGAVPAHLSAEAWVRLVGACLAGTGTGTGTSEEQQRGLGLVTVQLADGSSWSVRPGPHPAVTRLAVSPPDLHCLSPMCLVAGSPGPAVLYAAGVDLQVRRSAQKGMMCRVHYLFML